MQRDKPGRSKNQGKMPTPPDFGAVLDVLLSLVEKEARRARAWLRKELARR